MSDRYVVGQPVVLDATFTVVDVLTDPTTVTLLVTDPAGTATTYTYAGATITRTSVGTFTKTVTASTAGTWSFVWTSTGAAADVQDGTFTIFEDVPLSLYCSLDELKSRLRVDADDTNDDAEMLSAIHATCGWIDNTHCEDFFGRSTDARTFEACDGYLLDVDALVSVTTLKTDEAGDGTFETTWTAGTDYQLLPYNVSNGRETRPYRKIKAVGSRTFPYAYARGGQRSDLVQIVGVWGWPAVPWAVKEAALAIAQDTFSLRDIKFGVAGFDTFGVVRVKEDGPALRFLAGYRRLLGLVG